jgi:hypothetical protein
MSGVSRQVFLSCLQQDLQWIDELDRRDPFFTPQAVAKSSLLHSIFKKFEEPNVEADDKAIAKFLAANQLSWAWKIDTERLATWEEECLGTVKRYLDDFLHPAGDLMVPSFDTLFHYGDLGPGANLAGRGGDFYTKMFSSKLTVTSLDLYASYRRSIANLPSWLEAENHRLKAQGGPLIVEGNRTSCVPKNVDISRTICTEPTLNMWYQLGLGNIIRERLERFFGINLATVADVNRELARRGSIDDGCGSLSTIDLESASDSISLGMMKYMFPKWFMDIIMLLRSSSTELPDGSRVELGMVSTMGNGFTFPLQTLIFSCVVAAVYEQAGIPRKRVDRPGANWAVFGDDIIVVRDTKQCRVYDRVLRVLALLGFRPNADKSFSEGPFRESCGSDFYKGHFVRPVYIRRLGGPQDTYVAFNKLIRWVRVQGISLPTTLQYLLRKARFNPVPEWESDDAGFKVPVWFGGPKRRSATGSYVYKACVLSRKPIKLYPDYIKVPRGQSRRDLNPNGLLVAVTRGEFRDGELTPRQRGGRVVWMRRIALSWEIPPLSDLRGFLECERFALCNASFSKEAFGDAIWPIAGQVEGRRCETVFYDLSLDKA